ncbi:MAG: hypothetical protein P0Y56_09955 [Candidatus Andeanibacterium colombiense]|uniref:Uncharacterized protein n=1 Tax=Candidatus Andeanibacterium colombiense TaxID=3121345 RepID=A0AAJ5X3N5_9SPHN|nr:MAG: hypothetical protein P0Y56_09955 [Sphingomonadaceae bacterium]
MRDAPQHTLVSILPCSDIEASTAFNARIGLKPQSDYDPDETLVRIGWPSHLRE